MDFFSALREGARPRPWHTVISESSCRGMEARSLRSSRVSGSRTSDYDFDLPDDRIAQTPAGKRDESRLMVVHRDTGDIEHATFRDIADIIPSGDTIVVNTTKV